MADPTHDDPHAPPARTRYYAERGDTLDGFRRALERRGLRPSTIAARVHVVRRWWDFTGNPWRASRRDVEAFIDAGNLGTAKSRYVTVSHLHRFYVWARREGLTRRDPTELVERPRLTPGLPRPISDTDLAVAVALAVGPVRAALLLAATSGLRACELAQLRWEDVGVDWLRVAGKGGRERVVPLHPDARAALDDLDRPDGWVLPWRVTTDVAPGRRVSHALNGYLHSVGSRATLHQLRHWCGTNALAATRDLRAVQELLGHANPAHTALYTKLDPTHLRAAVNSIVVPGTGTPAEPPGVPPGIVTRRRGRARTAVVMTRSTPRPARAADPWSTTTYRRRPGRPR